MKRFSLSLLLIISSLKLFSEDPMKYNFSVLRSHDFSDSYGRGQMLSGEFKLSKSWYGASISYGFYQSVSYMKISFIVEEINETITIKNPEFANIKSCSFSMIAIPVKKDWFSTELYLGLALANAKTLTIRDVEFSYNHRIDEFDYIKRNYDLGEKRLVGYIAGVSFRFKIYEPLGFKLNISLQDMKNSVFAFVGYGLDFTF